MKQQAYFMGQQTYFKRYSTLELTLFVSQSQVGLKKYYLKLTVAEFELV